jgi:hypothetical protein
VTSSLPDSLIPTENRPREAAVLNFPGMNGIKISPIPFIALAILVFMVFAFWLLQ